MNYHNHNRIRIMIVDDHLMVREGLTNLLQTFPDLQLVAEASSGSEAIQLCNRAKPNVILMDLVMPEVDGITATRAICEQNPDVNVLALTSYKDNDMVKSALEAGATGYMLKNVSPEELAAGIRAAYQGKMTIAPEASQALVKSMAIPPPSIRDLTDREQEVLQLLVEGLSNNEIGDSLGISPHTVKNHLRSIYTKLRVSTRTAATTLAIKYGLVHVN